MLNAEKKFSIMRDTWAGYQRTKSVLVASPCVFVKEVLHLKRLISLLLPLLFIFSTNASAIKLSDNLKTQKSETRLCKWVKDGEEIEKEITFEYMNLGIEHKLASDKIKTQWHLSVNGWEVINPPLFWNGCNLGASYQLEEGDSYSVWCDPITFYSPGAIVINTSDYDLDDANYDVYSVDGTHIGGRHKNVVMNVIEIPEAGSYIIRFDRKFPDYPAGKNYPSKNNNVKIFCFGTSPKDIYHGDIVFTSDRSPIPKSEMTFPYAQDIQFSLSVYRNDKVKVEIIRAGQTWADASIPAKLVVTSEGDDEVVYEDTVRLNGQTHSTVSFEFEPPAGGTYDFTVNVAQDRSLDHTHGYVMRVVAPKQSTDKYATRSGDVVHNAPKHSWIFYCLFPFKVLRKE